jgi:hypothetical protein
MQAAPVTGPIDPCLLLLSPADNVVIARDGLPAGRSWRASMARTFT